MENPQIFAFCAIDRRAVLPKRQSEGAAGYDIYSIEGGVIQPGEIKPVRTGFTLEVPFNALGVVVGRSGFAKNSGIEAVASYVKNGKEVVANLHNTSTEPFEYEARMRVAQIMFLETENPDISAAPAGLEDASR